MTRILYRYLVVGLAGTAVHSAILIFLVQSSFLSPTWASVPAFLGALIVSHAANHYWTFKSVQALKQTFIRYTLASISGLLLNMAIMYSTVQVFSWPYLYGLLLGILLVPLSNFLLNLYWAFRS